MIPLNRDSIAIPPSLLTKAAKAKRTIVQAADKLKSQRRLEVQHYIVQQFASFTTKLTHGKCAYCETKISNVLVEHFRPRSSVREAPKHQGYYWLTYEWTNLLSCCATCYANKGNSFPLFGEELRAYEPQSRLQEERALLLDPSESGFAADAHLDFGEDGRVKGISPRGLASIEVLGLNRTDLRDRRAEIISLLKTISHRSKPSQIRALDLQIIERLRSPTEEYSAVALQWARSLFPFVISGDGAIAPRPTPTLMANIEQVTGDAQEMLKRSGRSKTSGYVRRVEFKNFRTLKDVGVDFTVGREAENAQSVSVGWQVLLGENGKGKTSFLQGLALALGGDENLDACTLPPERLLHQNRSRTAAEATVTVWLSTTDEPVILHVGHNDISYRGTLHGADMFLRAYGATRLMSSATGTVAELRRRDVKNLFRPTHSLVDVNRWLGGLTQEAFDKAAVTIKDVLLRWTSEVTLRRKGESVFVVTDGRRLTLEQLSQGQQSVLALAADLMAGLMQEQSERIAGGAPADFADAAGIVLLDEIDAHLHPRWKMRIVSSLRRAFPKIQFIATTHEPLCLRGLREGEIILMKEEEGKAQAIVSPKSTAGWRIDQILTSELFGLDTTIDPDIDEKFQRYYGLLAETDPQKRLAQEKERESLRKELQNQNRLGPTRRDQLIYDIIDEYLAREPHLLRPAREKLLGEIKKKVADIWDWAEAGAALKDAQS